MRLLFVCHGNTCRSVIAAALARQCFPDFDITSAGTDAWQATAQPSTIEVLEVDHGIDATTHVPTHISTLDLSAYDLIVALDTEVVTKLRATKVGASRLVAWDVPDPYDSSPDHYRETVSQIVPNLDELASRLRSEGARA